MRARMALHVAETEYEHREVILRDKPQAMLDASPKGSVPVFITSTDKVIDESLDIMRWALPDAQIDLNIIKNIDGPFKHHLDRYKYASRYDDTAKRGDVDLTHRADAVRALESLKSKLATAPFLSGTELDVTDMACFPFVRQFAAVEPEWWKEDPEVSNIRTWLAACVSSDLFKAIMIKHPLWAPKH